jgi:hypothetical protein
LFAKIREFFAGRKQRKIEKNMELVKNAKAIKEDRWAALQYFSTLDEPEHAVPGLLRRFNFSLEHGINDTKEKELAMEGILRHGEAALPYVTKHLSETDRIAWPLKILYKLGNEQQIVETLKSALNFNDVSFDRSAVDKNYDILCYLREHKLPGYVDQIAHFIKDHDERVRFAAVEVLIEQDDPSIAGLIERFIADESAENRRIRKSVIDAFVSRGWKLKHPEVFKSELITDGIFITKDAHLENRGGGLHS